MSFIGECLKFGLEVDGEIFKIGHKFCMDSEDLAGVTGSVALDLNVNMHFLTTTSGKGAFTLADGKKGQIKYVILKTKVTTNAVITPTNFGPGTTLTLGTTGESAILAFDGTNWQVVAYYSASVA